MASNIAKGAGVSVSDFANPIFQRACKVLESIRNRVASNIVSSRLIKYVEPSGYIFRINFAWL